MFLLLIAIFADAQAIKTENQKMKIEIWSDVICPFCYIGKRQFDNALAQFPNQEKIEVIWKSYQLSPDMKTDTSKSVYQFLAEHKGISLAQSKQMHENVVSMAKKEGLDYHFDKAISANSFRAHRFLHLAKAKNLQHQAEEKLFAAYFTEGKNIDDIGVLLQIATEIGIDTEEAKTALNSDSYRTAVQTDIQEAENIGVTGVPFFVLNRKYAVSGAQGTATFLQALQQAYNEWEKASN